tara:strand:- start:18233 stop:18709 length:477 start_codon:yes stop_codon:yes gene_type:complete
MAWTETNEGRLINNTETKALAGASAVTTSWLKVPKGALITAAIKSAHTDDVSVTIDVIGAKSSTPAVNGAEGGLDFTSLTHVAEDIMTDIIVISEDEAGSDDAPDTATVTLGDLGYDYVQFKQTASGASTANVVYDVWYTLAKQDYLVKTNGVGADPS